MALVKLRCEGPCGRMKHPIMFYRARNKLRGGRDILCKVCREAGRRRFRSVNGRCNAIL